MSSLFAATTLQSLAMLVVAAGVGGVLWWSQRSGARASGKQATAALPASSMAVKPEELRRWEIEMHELARSLAAEMGTRVAVLQQLLRSVESQSARLEGLLARAASVGEAPAESARIAGPHVRAPLRREEIVALAAGGATQDEIVTATGALPGEVELLLGLRRAAER
jgi:hypothetical protein